MHLKHNCEFLRNSWATCKLAKGVKTNQFIAGLLLKIFSLSTINQLKKILAE